MNIGKAKISVEFKLLTVGSASMATVTKSGSYGNYSPGRNVDPGDANEPLIFVPTLGLADYQVWIATAGGENWGGCNVWVSQDGDTYKQIGTMIGGCRYGELTAELPATVTTPDIVNTLSVDLSISGGTLTGGTEAEADALENLCYVGGEYISFADATLTDPNEYDLEYLVRGCYGTDMDVHADNADFVRLDDAIFKYDIEAGDVGRTIYVKLQSFNIFGRAVQDLSELTAYEYEIQDPGDEIIQLGSPY